MKRVDYDERLHAVYARGRAMTAAGSAGWLDAFERHFPEGRPLTLLDVGSGTGRWTPRLADRFGGPVFGVEPSARMRAVAQSQPPNDRVTYLAGSAEAIPLEDESCDGALIYFVWHHVPDRETAVTELHRVTRSGGRLLVRTNLSDRMPELWWYQYFPRAQVVDREMYRPLAAVISDFVDGGFTYGGLDEIDVQFAESRRADFEQIRLRALSTFEHLTEAEIETGFAAIERALDESTDATSPVMTRGDLLVLQRP